MLAGSALGRGRVLTITQEPDSSLYKPALDAIKDSIKTSTSSMTAVPKPLKFLRPHYEKLEQIYESWPQGDDKARKRKARMVVTRVADTSYAVLFGGHALGTGHDILGRPTRHP